MTSCGAIPLCSFSSSCSPQGRKSSLEAGRSFRDHHTDERMKGWKAVTSLPEAVQVKTQVAKQIVLWGQVSTIHRAPYPGITLGSPCKYLTRRGTSLGARGPCDYFQPGGVNWKSVPVTLPSNCHFRYTAPRVLVPSFPAHSWFRINIDKYNVKREGDLPLLKSP